MRVLVPFLILLLSGCATMFGEPQAVWMRSDPPGADIDTGFGVVGQTPLYVFVKREKTPRVLLSKDGVDKVVRLPTKYRWQASFFSNLVFYVAAPIGWVTDLLTGKAWNPQDPPVTSFRLANDKRPTGLPPLDAVAIAPPRADSVALSNSAAPLLARALAKRKYSVLPYDSTLPLFLKRGYDFDGHGSYDDKRNLYERLDADAVWTSTLRPIDSGFMLEANLEDKRTQKTIDHLNIAVDADSGLSRTYSRARSLFGLPNAVTVSSVVQNFAFDRGQGYTGYVTLSQADADQWYEWLGQNLSALSITNIPAYRSGRSGRWQFSIYPILKLSHRTLVARGASDIDGQNFSRWLVALGIGPELGYQINRSYFYVNFFENASYTAIDWSFNQRASSVTQNSLQTSFEFGYLYSFSESWSLRLFSNVLQENSAAWKEALTRTSKAGIPVTNQSESIANNTSFGLSLGFSFEPLLVRGFSERK